MSEILKELSGNYLLDSHVIRNSPYSRHALGTDDANDNPFQRIPNHLNGPRSQLLLLPGEPTPQERYGIRIRNELYVLAGLAIVNLFYHFAPMVVDYFKARTAEQNVYETQQAQEMINLQRVPFELRTEGERERAKKGSFLPSELPEDISDRFHRKGWDPNQ